MLGLRSPRSCAKQKSAKRGADIAIPLLSLGVGGEPGPAQDGVLEVLLDRGGLSLYQIRDLMRSWGSLGPAFKDRLFAHLEAGLRRPPKPMRHIRDLDGHTRTRLIEMVSTLTFVELPAEDAWRFTRLLFYDEVLASSGNRGMYTWETPWSYWCEHLEEAPDDVLRTLERIAKAEPDAFVYILGEGTVVHWEKLPDSCKAAFFADTCLRDARAQEKALQGIAQHWERVPKELRDLFNAQATSEDPEIRDAAMTAAFISRWRGNPDLQKVLLGAARDPEIKIPLRLLHSGAAGIPPGVGDCGIRRRGGSPDRQGKARLRCGQQSLVNRRLTPTAQASRLPAGIKDVRMTAVRKAAVVHTQEQW